MFAVDRTPLGEKLFYAPGSTGCRCRENPGFRRQNSQPAELSLIVEELAEFEKRAADRETAGRLYGCRNAGWMLPVQRIKIKYILREPSHTNTRLPHPSPGMADRNKSTRVCTVCMHCPPCAQILKLYGKNEKKSACKDDVPAVGVMRPFVRNLIKRRYRYIW